MEFGEKLKFLRLQNRMTLKDLSQRSKVSVSLLSQIERNISVPTVTTVQKIANAIGITISSLFSDHEAEAPGFPGNKNGLSSLNQNRFPSHPHRNLTESKPVTVVRCNRRKKMITPWGAHYEMLCPNLQRRIEFIHLHYPVGTKVEEFYSHEGEECGIVLEGKFKAIIADEEFVLEPGDSIYFDSSIPHRWENAGEVDVKAIWAITPPSF